MLNSHSEIIDLWPSKSALATDVNAKTPAVCKWHARGRIPPEYWAPLVEATKQRQIVGVTLELLARIAAKSRNGSEAA